MGASKAKRYFSVLLLLWVLSPLYGISTLNPSFEEGSGNLPKGWSAFGTAQFYWDSQVYRSGTRSLKITNSLDPAGGQRIAGWLSPVFKVQPFCEYIFEGYIKTQGATGETYLCILWYKEKKWLASYISQILSGTQDWAKVSVIDRPPKEANYLQLAFRSDNNQTYAWLDDVSLQIKPIYKINFAPNPSFEHGDC